MSIGNINTLFTQVQQPLVGQFKDNNIEGNGIWTFANGDIYEGQYRASKMHGQGAFITADGQKVRGEWKDGEFWNGTVSDKGKVYRIFKNGEYEVIRYND